MPRKKMQEMFLVLQWRMPKNGGDILITKEIESLVKLRDAFRMASEAIDEYVDSMAPKEVAGFTWNPDKIKWVMAEGTSGPYERSEDVNSIDFKELIKDLEVHNGKLSRNGFFYWKFVKSPIIGRKKRSK